MKKLLPILLPLSLILILSCQEREQPVPYFYSFSIVDSVNGENLIGDSTNTNRYNIDSIKFLRIIGNNVSEPSSEYYNLENNPISGYKFIIRTSISPKGTGIKSNVTYLIKYNNNVAENDTLNTIYGINTINVYRNNELIYNNENISQTTEIHFNIIK
jgi:hypothetical protein